MRIWMAALAALTVQGCAERADTPPPADPYSWTLDDGPALRYGAKGAAAELRFACAEGSGKVSFDLLLDDNAATRKPAGTQWPITVMLRSEATTRQYFGEAVAGDAGAVATAQAQADDTVFATFGVSGELAAEGRPRIADTAAEQADVRRFFDLCREKP
jgi:hypothetical protein